MPRKREYEGQGAPNFTVRMSPDVAAWLRAHYPGRIREYLEQLVRDAANLSATYRGEAPPFPPREEHPDA